MYVSPKQGSKRGQNRAITSTLKMMRKLKEAKERETTVVVVGRVKNLRKLN